MSAPKKILIVEDQAPIRDLLAAYLEDSGYRVQGAGGGAEGLERLAADAPDLLITDLRMPHMDGLTFIKKARAAIPGLRIFVLSGTGDRSAIAAALEAGAKACFLKPLRLAEFEAAVAAEIGKPGEEA